MWCTRAAVPYFIAYSVIGNFVFLNVAVAVILESFSAAKELEEEQSARREKREAELVTEDHMEEFKRIWESCDRDAGNQLPYACLPYIVAKLKFPLGVAGHPDASVGSHSAPSDAKGAGGATARDHSEEDGAMLAEPEEIDDDEHAETEATILSAGAVAASQSSVWLPKVSEGRLFQAQRLVARLQLKYKARLEAGTRPVTFTAALDALVDHAFKFEVNVEDTFFSELAKKCAPLHPCLPACPLERISRLSTGLSSCLNCCGSLCVSRGRRRKTEDAIIAKARRLGQEADTDSEGEAVGTDDHVQSSGTPPFGDGYEQLHDDSLAAADAAIQVETRSVPTTDDKRGGVRGGGGEGGGSGGGGAPPTPPPPRPSVALTERPSASLSMATETRYGDTSERPKARPQRLRPAVHEWKGYEA